MDKNVEAIATKFLTRPEDFELIKEENYKNYVVYFAAYKEANGNTNYGLPIFILIDKLGKARFAEPDETRELMRRWNSDEEEDDGGLTPAWDRDVSSVPGRAAGKRVCFCQLKTMTQFVSS